jgi:hypothetical protein
MELDLSFGCGIFVDRESNVRDMDKSRTMVWENYVSFFGSAEGSIDLKFDNINLFSWISFVLAEIVDYKLDFKHLKMMKGDQIIVSRE